MATLVGLLASTGLRSGEAVRLDRGDVDLTSGVILVRKTKFRKDRLVPVLPTTQAALRRWLPHGVAETQPFSLDAYVDRKHLITVGPLAGTGAAGPKAERLASSVFPPP